MWTTTADGNLAAVDLPDGFPFELSGIGGPLALGPGVVWVLDDQAEGAFGVAIPATP